MNQTTRIVSLASFLIVLSLSGCDGSGDGGSYYSENAGHYNSGNTGYYDSNAGGYVGSDGDCSYVYIPGSGDVMTGNC